MAYNSFERILTSVPINKTAAIAAKGTTDNPELTVAQKRENLLPMLGKLERAIANAKTPEDRKRFGQMKLMIQNEISKLRPSVKYPRDFANFFMDAAKEILPAATFIMIRNEATRTMQSKNKDEVSA